MWNEDGGTSSELTYKNVPFFISSRGYGVFIPCPGFVTFEIQSERMLKSFDLYFGSNSLHRDHQN